jgi:hypothetical protein
MRDDGPPRFGHILGGAGRSRSYLCRSLLEFIKKKVLPNRLRSSLEKISAFFIVYVNESEIKSRDGSRGGSKQKASECRAFI